MRGIGNCLNSKCEMANLLDINKRLKINTVSFERT